jgi:hypothetical protein
MTPQICQTAINCPNNWAGVMYILGYCERSNISGIPQTAMGDEPESVPSPPNVGANLNASGTLCQCCVDREVIAYIRRYSMKDDVTL